MLKIGVAGGIGSGKSAFVSIFHDFGIPIFSADQIARELTDSDPSIKKKIISRFGTGSYHLDSGRMDRKFIAGIVFADREKLNSLNSIVHPAVITQILRCCAETEKNNNFQYCLIEAALLFESGLERSLDYTAGILASRKNKIERVGKRDSVSEDETIRRIDSQSTDAELAARCDFTVTNDGSFDDLKRTAAFFHAMFSKLRNQLG